MAEITVIEPIGGDCGGERGKRGKRGHRGHDGSDGATGPTGATGALGPTGPTSVPGPETLNLSPYAFSAHESASGAPPAGWVLLNPLAALPNIAWSMGAHTDAYLSAALDFDVGTTITGFSGSFDKASDGTNTLTFALLRISLADGTVTNVLTLGQAAPGPWNPSIVGLAEVVAAGFAYILCVTMSDPTPSSADQLFGATVSH
jgi:hypothetical protein